MTPNFFDSLAEDLPVLFAYIGWADKYDGSEQLTGRHRSLSHADAEIMEDYAFFRGEDGYFRSGVGRGRIRERRLHIVFVAEPPTVEQKLVVGVYANAEFGEFGEFNYSFARTRTAFLIPTSKRPPVQGWISGQSMRKAKRRRNKSHEELEREFGNVKNFLVQMTAPES